MSLWNCVQLDVSLAGGGLSPALIQCCTQLTSHLFISFFLSSIFVCCDKTEESFYRQKMVPALWCCLWCSSAVSHWGLKIQQLLLVFNSFSLSSFQLSCFHLQFGTGVPRARQRRKGNVKWLCAWIFAPWNSDPLWESGEMGQEGLRGSLFFLWKRDYSDPIVSLSLPEKI